MFQSKRIFRPFITIRFLMAFLLVASLSGRGTGALPEADFNASEGVLVHHLDEQQQHQFGDVVRVVDAVVGHGCVQPLLVVGKISLPSQMLRSCGKA